LADVYGKVFSLRVGSDKMIIVSGYKMVKEALITQFDSFVDRPNVPLFHKIYKGLGKYADYNAKINGVGGFLMIIKLSSLHVTM